MKKKVDTIREKLDFGSLEGSDRAALFDDFKKVGGNVIKLGHDYKSDEKDKFDKFLEEKAEAEKKKRKKELNAKEKEKNFQAKQKLDKERKQKEAEELEELENRKLSPEERKQIVEEKRKEKHEQTIKNRVIRQQHDEKLDKQMSLISAKISCIFGGVFNLFGSKFSRKFILRDTLTFLKTSLQNTRQVLTSVLHQDESVIALVKDGLERQEHTYYFELLARFDNILDEKNFQLIAGASLAAKPIDESKPYFKKLFKQMYILKPYFKLLQNSVGVVLKMEEKIRKLQPSLVNNNIQTVLDTVNFVFHRYFPRIELLISYYYKKYKNVHKGSNVREFLEFDEKDVLGYYTHAWKEEEKYRLKKATIEAAIKSNKERPVYSEDVMKNIDEVPDVPNFARKGLKLIYDNHDFRKALSFYKGSKDARKLFQLVDKVFLMYSLIDFFEKEFSFLFVSDKVQFDMFTDKMGRKIDTKNTIKRIHYKFNDIYRKIKEYLKLLVDYNRVVDKAVGSKEIKRIEHQRESLYRTMNQEARKIVEDLLKMFQYVVRDSTSEKKVVINPNYKLDFRKSTEHNVCNHINVMDAFVFALEFLSGFYHILRFGDLTPDTVFIDKPIFLNLR